jgi:hypothetical protein
MGAIAEDITIIMNIAAVTDGMANATGDRSTMAN